jgi:aspartate racemase
MTKQEAKDQTCPTEGGDREMENTLEERKIIGILGGLGPSATVDVFAKIVKHTPATCDQDHLRIIIDNNPQIPDRTAYYQGRGEDPSGAMLATAKNLQEAGATFIIIPCNTAHAFIDSIQQGIDIPIISMLEETASYIAENFEAVKTVGLLATSGTVISGVYTDVLSQHKLSVVVPSKESQRDLVMEAVYGEGGIKAGVTIGAPRDQLLQAAHELVALGAQAIILGCTEIPLALHDGDLPLPLIDATDILAQAAVRHALA